MELFNIIAILITLSALFGYVNYRFIKLPTIIGMMLISILMSISLVVLGHLGLGIEEYWMPVVQSIDFNKTLMVGMLSFLIICRGSASGHRGVVKAKMGSYRLCDGRSFYLDSSCRGCYLMASWDGWESR